MANATENRYALITGATNGIGYELAKLFAGDGYNLVIVARTEEDLQQRAKEFSGQYNIQVIPIAKDLFQPNAAFELYEEVKQKNVIVDVLVNDAGQGQSFTYTLTNIEFSRGASIKRGRF
jgi:short-subunit dehydrogenase